MRRARRRCQLYLPHSPRRSPPLALVALALVLAGCVAAPAPPLTTISGTATSTVAPGGTPARALRRWVIMHTQHLALAVDRATATLLIRPEERAQAEGVSIQEGDDPGSAAGGVSLHEEYWGDGQTFTGGSPPGEPVTVTAVRDGDEVRILLGAIPLAKAGAMRWTVSTRGTTVRVGRSTSIKQADQGAQTALVMVLPPPAGTGQRLVIIDGAAYPATDGLAQQHGRVSRAMVGAVDLDPSGLLLSVRGDEAAAPALDVRDGVTRLALGLPLTAGALGTATLQFAAPTELQAPRSTFSPILDARFLAAGYYGNVVDTTCCGPLLRASMVSYPTTIWIRDLAYAAEGYGYVLEDLGPLRNTLQAFLDRTDDHGAVSEFITVEGESVRRGAWDSQPDLVRATYAYVAQSGDLAFVERNRATLQRVATWMLASDTDGDGLPDRSDVPYGYFDSVANGVRHTYAVASFYRAYLALAELEEVTGHDGATYRAAAGRLQDAFNRPVAEGGFWLPDQPYPLAWFTATGAPVTGFETFGVLAAIDWGLIPPGPRRDALLEYIREQREAFTDGAPFGERLMLGGYDPHLRRDVIPAVEPWLLDASAPWIAALDVPVRLRAGQTEDANLMLARYLAAYDAGSFPLPEFVAGAGARYGGGRTSDAGRSWDSAAWFIIVYSGHYGLQPTPAALRIHPAPLRTIAGDTVTGYRYGAAHVTLTLDEGGYSVRVDQPCALILQPPAGAAALTLDGGVATTEMAIRAVPGHTYSVRSVP